MDGAGMNRPRTAPVPPDGSYLRAMTEATARAVETAEPIPPECDGAPERLRLDVERRVEGYAAELVALSRDLHAHPEEAFAEHRSATALAATLQRRGHSVQTDVHGLDTAVRSSAGAGRPHVAVLAEYDALPG